MAQAGGTCLLTHPFSSLFLQPLIRPALEQVTLAEGRLQPYQSYRKTPFGRSFCWSDLYEPHLPSRHPCHAADRRYRYHMVATTSLKAQRVGTEGRYFGHSMSCGGTLNRRRARA